MNLKPTTLILTLSEASQDARDLYSEHKLTCACCGRDNRSIPSWWIPGLCSDCAEHVESTTVAAPHSPRPPLQTSLFDTSRMPG